MRILIATVTAGGGHLAAAAALEEAWRLRRSYVRTVRLLQGASEFHLNWSQLRGAMTGGYRETGESAPVVYGHRISLHG